MSSEVETPRTNVDASIPIGQIPPMDRDTALSRLKAHETELRAMGVAGLSLLGSVSRGGMAEGLGGALPDAASHHMFHP